MFKIHILQNTWIEFTIPYWVTIHPNHVQVKGLLLQYFIIWQYFPIVSKLFRVRSLVKSFNHSTNIFLTLIMCSYFAGCWGYEEDKKWSLFFFIAPSTMLVWSKGQQILSFHLLLINLWSFKVRTVVKSLSCYPS